MKDGNMTLVYCAVALLSAMLLLGYLLWEKKKEKYFSILFACVMIVNIGYFLQSISHTLTGIMMANRLSYLGAAYSMLVMLLIIMEMCQIRRKKWVTGLLFGITTLAFALAASGNLLGLFYKEVTLVNIHGMSKLIKEYGPLHGLYPLYLLSYFVMMLLSVFQASRNGKLSSGKFLSFLLAVVSCNLIVWGVEQLIDVDFEFLSISYIVTEVMLLLIFGLLRDYGIVQADGTVISVQMLTHLNTIYATTGELPPNMKKMFVSFAEKVRTLSSAERRILNYYIDGYEIADIPDLAYISINTVKKHNRSIYQKLEVASRDELMLYIELFRSCGRLHELTGVSAEIE